MAVYRVDVTFMEETGAYIELLADNPDHASSLVTEILAEAKAINPKIVSVTELRSDEENEQYKATLN